MTDLKAAVEELRQAAYCPGVEVGDKFIAARANAADAAGLLQRLMSLVPPDVDCRFYFSGEPAAVWVIAWQ